MTEPKEEKCEACCGSGYINFWTDDGHISMRTCRRCDGYGYIKVKQMTKEEWLRQASTEEIEHALTMLIMKDRFFADKEFAYVNIRFGVHCWLKEKHE